MPGALLIDRRSRNEFGPQKRNTRVELNKQEFHIAGDFEMGTGFAIDGAALLNHHNFVRAFGGDALDFPTLGLVKIADARDTGQIVERLRKALPISDKAGGIGADVRVMSRNEILGNETRYWVSERSIGILFRMGVVISFIVGFVVFYQVFSSDIADHIGEYATLKAIGYSNGQVGSIVVSQAVLLGLVGYAFALVAAWAIYWLVESMTRMPMSLWDVKILAVPLALGLVISCGSALFPFERSGRRIPPISSDEPPNQKDATGMVEFDTRREAASGVVGRRRVCSCPDLHRTGVLERHARCDRCPTRKAATIRTGPHSSGY